MSESETTPQGNLPNRVKFGATELVFREAGLEGLDAIRPLSDKLGLCMAQLSPRFGDHWRSRTFEEKKQKILTNASGGKLWVTTVAPDAEGASVAVCICTVSACGAGEIETLFVEQHLRGRGIGSELMRRALGWLDSMGARSKVVWVIPENERAAALYRHFGFYPRSVLLAQRPDGAA
jgi:ribosomal protein S18 acetylase RimI-like enzyme